MNTIIAWWPDENGRIVRTKVLSATETGSVVTKGEALIVHRSGSVDSLEVSPTIEERMALIWVGAGLRASDFYDSGGTSMDYGKFSRMVAGARRTREMLHLQQVRATREPGPR